MMGNLPEKIPVVQGVFQKFPGTPRNFQKILDYLVAPMK
jgi:hypothetical protein